MKKLLALLCVAVMLVACCLPVFAAGGSCSITINNTVDKHDYYLYKILDLSYDDKGTVDPGDDAYTYTIENTSDWWTFIDGNSGTNGNQWFELISAGGNTFIVKAQGTPDAKEIAAAALAYAKAKPITGIKQTATGTSLTFASLEYGYYLVESSVGTLLGLDTVSPHAEINDKNKAPTIDKVVDDASVNIGDTVNFTLTITAQEGAENYKLHDKMSAGLKLNETSIKVYQADGVTEITEAGNYTIKTSGTCGAECTFEIEFTDAFCDTLVADQEIVVKYSAVLTEDAVVGAPGNPNKAVLDYGDDSNVETTPEAVADVTTYEFDLVKTDSVKVLLAGAKFRLYDAATDGNEIKLAYDDVDKCYYPTNGAGEDIVTNGSEVIVIRGLAADTYYLEEIEAPAGYNKLVGRTAVNLTSGNLKATMAGTTWTSGGIQITNNTGAVLPETGGFGTTMFLLIGGGLMLCTGILLVTKKRMDKIAD